ncbi:MAG: hypothetical protein ACLGHO_04085 [Gammaproteobacteria bacterium]
MLGPLQDILNVGDRPATEIRALADVAHRNALRLLNHVNSLLNFARIESGGCGHRTSRPISPRTPPSSRAFFARPWKRPVCGWSSIVRRHVRRRSSTPRCGKPSCSIS